MWSECPGWSRQSSLTVVATAQQSQSVPGWSTGTTGKSTSLSGLSDLLKCKGGWRLRKKYVNAKIWVTGVYSTPPPILYSSEFSIVR